MDTKRVQRWGLGTCVFAAHLALSALLMANLLGAMNMPAGRSGGDAVAGILLFILQLPVSLLALIGALRGGDLVLIGILPAGSLVWGYVAAQMFVAPRPGSQRFSAKGLRVLAAAVVAIAIGSHFLSNIVGAMPLKADPSEKHFNASNGSDLRREARAYPNVESVSLQEGKGFTAQDLASLKPLRSLHDLGFGWTDANDSALAGLRNMDQLESLQFGDDPITDAGLEPIGTLINLKDLRLYDTQVTDAGMVFISRLNKLESLSLGDTRVTVRSLGPLAALPKLATLDLSRTNTIGPGLEALTNFPSLENLDLGDTPINDEDLKALAKATHLKQLHLQKTKITNAGLPALAALQSLETLDVAETAVTLPAAQELQKKMPRVIIDLIVMSR